MLTQLLLAVAAATPLGPPPVPVPMPSRTDRFLLAAAAEAEQSTLETKHGSLLVRGGKVLGSGHNSSRSRKQVLPGESNVISLHSEVAAAAAVPCLLPRLRQSQVDRLP